MIRRPGRPFCCRAWAPQLLPRLLLWGVTCHAVVRCLLQSGRGASAGLPHLPGSKSNHGQAYCDPEAPPASSFDFWTLSSENLLAMFPVDPVKENYVRKVKNCIFSIAFPTPFKSRVRLVAVSKEVMEDILDLDLSVSETDDFIQLVSGGKIAFGSVPLTHRYGGHQFGIWADQLGDGRAHLIGTYMNRAARILDGFPDLYYNRFRKLFKAKLGLLGEGEGDDKLIAFLLHLMEETEADFTMTFRQLSQIAESRLLELSIPQHLWALKTVSRHELFPTWVSQYLLRLKSNVNDSDSERRKRMTAVNPRYVLKNWMAESAVRKAERNDFSEVRLLQQVLWRPFQQHSTAEAAGYASPPPPWAKDLRVSCSS